MVKVPDQQEVVIELGTMEELMKDMFDGFTSKVERRFDNLRSEIKLQQ